MGGKYFKRLVSSFCILYPVVVSNNGSLKIISITGAHSSVGKTTLASILLNNVEGFGAIKYTKTPLYTTVTDEAEVIMQESKDTAIMAGSGAEKVVWIQSPAGGLQNALDIAVGKMIDLEGVVVEGNSPVDFLNPYLVVFIVGADGAIKPTATRVAKRADVIIINTANSKADPSLFTSLYQGNAKVFQIDLINKTGDIDKFVAYFKKCIKENN